LLPDEDDEESDDELELELESVELSDFFSALLASLLLAPDSAAAAVSRLRRAVP
jgi:hypothetical protein